MNKDNDNRTNRKLISLVTSLALMASMPAASFAATDDPAGYDNTSGADGSIKVVESAEELSSEVRGADNPSIITIDVEDDVMTEELATEEIAENADQILSGVGGTEARAEALAECLEDSGYYTVTNKGDGELEASTGFATQRLMVIAPYSEDMDTHGAVNGAYYEDYYVLGYDSQEAAKQAYDAFESEGVSVISDIPLKADSISWGTKAMGMDVEKTRAAKGKTVTVAVIDSGINSSHPIFDGRQIYKPYNILSGNTNVTDVANHGTAVAGIIADSTPANVRIMPILAMDESGGVSLIDMFSALNYAEKNGAEIVNMSFGGNCGSAGELRRLSERLDAVKPLMVTAAGNESLDLDTSWVHYFPAEASNPICVSAITSNSSVRAYFSNYGNAVDFSAPGVGIRSADRSGGYSISDGTSLATPHVTAAAANLLALNGASSKGLKTLLKSIAWDNGAKGRDRFFGYGYPIFPTMDVTVSTSSAADVVVSVKSPYPFTGSAITPKVTVKKDNKVLSEGNDYQIIYASSRIIMGRHYLTVKMKGRYRGSGRAEYSIVKGINTVSATGKTVSVKSSKVKKQAVVIPRTAAMTISRPQGNVTYGKAAGRDCLLVNGRTGAVTVKKNTQKGTYRAIVRVTAAGNSKYSPRSAFATVTVKVR